MTGELWHIVIVDPSPGDRAEARRLLLKGSDRRYAFTEAETAAAGMRALRECAAVTQRCVLLSCHLPDMTVPAFMAAINGNDVFNWLDCINVFALVWCLRARLCKVSPRLTL